MFVALGHARVRSIQGQLSFQGLASAEEPPPSQWMALDFSRADHEPAARISTFVTVLNSPYHS